MPIRISIIVAGCITLLSACGGGGGAAGGNDPGSASLNPELNDIALQQGDVIPLTSLHVNGSDLSAFNLSSSTNGIISTSEGNLTALAVGKTTLTVSNAAGASTTIGIRVCSDVHAAYVLPVGGENINSGFSHASGTAVKVNTPLLLAAKAYCTGDKDYEEGQNPFYFYPAKKITISDQIINAGQKLQLSSAGVYHALFEFYDGSISDVEITAFSSLSTLQKTAVVTDTDTNKPFWFTGTAGPVQFIFETGNGESLNISQHLEYQSNNSTSVNYTSDLSGVNAQNVEYVAADFAETRMHKTRFFADVAVPIDYQVYGIYQNRAYNITAIADLRFTALEGQSDNFYRIKPGLISVFGNAYGEFWLNGSSNLRSHSVEVGPAIPTAQQGRWQYVASGDTRWLGSHSNRTFTEVDSNTLIDNTSNEGLIRAGISAVQITGTLDSIVALSSATVNSSKASTRSGGLSGIGGLDVILQNLDSGESTKVQTDADGNFSGEVASGNYLISSEVERDNNGTSEIVKIEAPTSISGENKDLGEFTLTPLDDYSFKASLREDDLTFFGYNDTTVEYTRTLRITNTGGKDISGAKAKIALANSSNMKRSFSVWNITPTGSTPVVLDADGYFQLGGISPFEEEAFGRGYKDFEIRFALYRPTEDVTDTINLEVVDDQDRAMNDRISLPVSSSAPVTLQIYARVGSAPKSVNGYIVAPGRRLIRLSPANLIGDAVTYDVPFKAGDSYDIVFSNTSADSETYYSLAVGTTTNVSTLEAFNTTDIYEEDDNANDATVVHQGDVVMAYASTNDVDFYRFDMTETAP